jgi:hypothetical protein
LQGANFNDFHAFSFLVAVTFLAGLWSFVLTVVTLVKMFCGDKQFSTKFYFAQFFLDAVSFLWFLTKILVMDLELISWKTLQPILGKPCFSCTYGPEINVAC